MRPMRTNWWMPAIPPKIASSSMITCPASVALLAMMTRSPTMQSCATWQYAMIRHFDPTRVSPPSKVAQFSVTHSRITVCSPTTRRGAPPLYFKSCVLPPTLAKGQTSQPAPSVACPSTLTCERSTTPSPSRTFGPTVQNGPIVTSVPSSAPGATTANE